MGGSLRRIRGGGEKPLGWLRKAFLFFLSWAGPSAAVMVLSDMGIRGRGFTSPGGPVLAWSPRSSGGGGARGGAGPQHRRFSRAPHTDTLSVAQWFWCTADY